MKSVSLALAVLIIGSQAFAQGLGEADKKKFAELLSSQGKWNQLIKSSLDKAAGKPGQPPVDYKPIEQNCKITIVPPEKKGDLKTPDDQQKVGKFSVDIDGTSCPISIHAGIDGVQTADGFDGQLVLESKALSPELKGEMDVDQIKLTMDFSAHLTKQGTDPKAPVLTTISMTGKGIGNSQKFGAFSNGSKLSASILLAPPANGSGFPDLNMLMGEEMSYSFSGISAELKSDMKMQGLFGPTEAHYFLNGQPITQDEYGQYRKEIDLPMDKPADGGGTAPAQPLQCEVSVYDAAQVSRTQLNLAIATGSNINVTPVLTGKSCDSSGMWNSTHGSDQVSAITDYQAQNVDLVVSINQQQNSTLSFLRDQNSDMAGQIGSYTYRFKCDLVPACH